MKTSASVRRAIAAAGAGALVLLAACGGGSSAPDTGLLSTTPVGGSQAADPSTVVAARFAEDLRDDTVSSETVQVDQGGKLVSGSVSYDSALHEIRFAPATPLEMLTSYQASLSPSILTTDGQPIEPVTWHFRTRDGEWQDEDRLPAIVDQPESREFGAHAYSPDGSLWAIWAEHDGAVGLWAALRTPAGWSEPSELARVYIENFDLVASTDLMPTMATNSRGAAVATWVYPKRDEFDSPRFDELWSARWDGTAWSAPERIGSTTGRAYGAKVSLDDAGNALVIWRQDYNEWPDRTPLLSQRHVAGVGWEAPQELPGSQASAYHWRLDAQPDGHALVTWSDQEVGRISTARFSPSAGWTDTSPLDIPTVASNIVARQRPDGSAAVAWTQTESFGIASLWFAIQQSDGSWQTPAQLDADMERHDLAVGPSGEVRLVYSKASGGTQVLTRRLPAGGFDWSAPERAADFPESTKYHQFVVRMVLDHVGRGVMAIEQVRNDNSRRLWTSRLAEPAGGAWSAPELAANGSYTLQDLVGGPFGRAVLVWDVDPKNTADKRFE